MDLRCCSQVGHSPASEHDADLHDVPGQIGRLSFCNAQRLLVYEICAGQPTPSNCSASHSHVLAVDPSQDFQLPPGEKPPLLIKIHGGPTSQASTAFSLGIQYWTSRGAPTGHTSAGVLQNLRRAAAGFEHLCGAAQLTDTCIYWLLSCC